MIGYIYALYDKDENDVIYIGQSVNPKERVKAHNATVYRCDYGIIEDRVLIKPQTNYRYFIVEEVEFEEKKELNRCEIYWIHQFKQWGFNLENKNYYRNFDFGLNFVWLNLEDDLYYYVLGMANQYSQEDKRHYSLPETLSRIITEVKESKDYPFRSSECKYTKFIGSITSFSIALILICG